MKLLISSSFFIVLYLCSSVELSNDNAKFLYYAYGSNLLAKRLHIANPSAVFHSIAKLANHRLDFNIYNEMWNGAGATIVEDPESEVWGALWVLDVKDMDHLDKQEHVYDGSYYAKNVTVFTADGVSLAARTYQQTIGFPKVPSYSIPADRQPSDTYMEVILYGAFECFLPMRYIRFLFTFPTNNKIAEWSLRYKLGHPFNRTGIDEDCI